MLEHFEFSIGGFFDGYHEVEIDRQADGAYQGIYTPPIGCLLEGSQKREFAVDARDVEELDEFLSAELHGWKNSYFNSDVLDGTQWGLERNERHYDGSNAFPDNFDFVLKWLVDKFEIEELAGHIGIGDWWANHG